MGRSGYDAAMSDPDAAKSRANPAAAIFDKRVVMISSSRN
jgi:hypothetical protein